MTSKVESEAQETKGFVQMTNNFPTKDDTNTVDAYYILGYDLSLEWKQIIERHTELKQPLEEALEVMNTHFTDIVYNVPFKKEKKKRVRFPPNYANENLTPWQKLARWVLELQWTTNIICPFVFACSRVDNSSLNTMPFILNTPVPSYKSPYECFLQFLNYKLSESRPYIFPDVNTDNADAYNERMDIKINDIVQRLPNEMPNDSFAPLVSRKDPEDPSKGSSYFFVAPCQYQPQNSEKYVLIRDPSNNNKYYGNHCRVIEATVTNTVNKREENIEFPKNEESIFNITIEMMNIMFVNQEKGLKSKFDIESQRLRKCRVSLMRKSKVDNDTMFYDIADFVVRSPENNTIVEEWESAAKKKEQQELQNQKSADFLSDQNLKAVRGNEQYNENLRKQQQLYEEMVRAREQRDTEMFNLSVRVYESTEEYKDLYNKISSRSVDISVWLDKYVYKPNPTIEETNELQYIKDITTNWKNELTSLFKEATTYNEEAQELIQNSTLSAGSELYQKILFLYNNVSKFSKVFDNWIQTLNDSYKNKEAGFQQTKEFFRRRSQKLQELATEANLKLDEKTRNLEANLYAQRLAQRAEQQRLARKRAAEQRLAQQRAEQQRLAQQRAAEQQRLAQQAEQAEQARRQQAATKIQKNVRGKQVRVKLAELKAEAAKKEKLAAKANEDSKRAQLNVARALQEEAEKKQKEAEKKQKQAAKTQKESEDLKKKADQIISSVYERDKNGKTVFRPKKDKKVRGAQQEPKNTPYSELQAGDHKGRDKTKRNNFVTAKRATPKSERYENSFSDNYDSETPRNRLGVKARKIEPESKSDLQIIYEELEERLGRKLDLDSKQDMNLLKKWNEYKQIEHDIRSIKNALSRLEAYPLLPGHSYGVDFLSPKASAANNGEWFFHLTSDTKQQLIDIESKLQFDARGRQIQIEQLLRSLTKPRFTARAAQPTRDDEEKKMSAAVTPPPRGRQSKPESKRAESTPDSDDDDERDTPVDTTLFWLLLGTVLGESKHKTST